VKVLVFSDSHSALSFMRRAVDAIKPDAIIHLGDHYDDGETIAFENQHIRCFQVAGNCDAYRAPGKPEMLCLPVCGALFYMVHGHRQGVKQTQSRLMAEARAMGAQAALYGHTHEAHCHREDDGLWVINPGSCGGYGGTVALLSVENGQLQNVRILTGEAFTW